MLPSPDQLSKPMHYSAFKTPGKQVRSNSDAKVANVAAKTFVPTERSSHSISWGIFTDSEMYGSLAPDLPGFSALEEEGGVTSKALDNPSVVQKEQTAKPYTNSEEFNSLFPIGESFEGFSSDDERRDSFDHPRRTSSAGLEDEDFKVSTGTDSPIDEEIEVKLKRILFYARGFDIDSVLDLVMDLDDEFKVALKNDPEFMLFAQNYEELRRIFA